MGIFESLRFEGAARICRGWSGDEKFRIDGPDGVRYLLRLSPAQDYERRERVFRLMESVSALGIPMCAPVEFGRCPEGVYTLLGWIDGRDAEAAVPAEPPARQYAWGMEAGQMLRRIHAIPAPEPSETYDFLRLRKFEDNLEKYRTCGITYEGGEAFVGYLQENIGLCARRPAACLHGDYHLGNMMMAAGDRLTVIDFDRAGYGDPWQDFRRIVWCAQRSPAFAAGMVNGYFEGDVPMLFWRILALYTAGNALGAIAWAIPFGQGEVDVILNQGRDVLEWYDGMRQVVPSWYLDHQTTFHRG